MDNGVWCTVGGRRIFIKEGQELATAMKESGKFGKDNENEIAFLKTINDFRKETLELKDEKAIIIDKNNNIVGKSQGQENHVDVEIELMKGNIVIHNHPMSKGFSKGDLETFIKNEVHGVVATGRTNSFIIKRKEGFNDFIEDFKKESFYSKATKSLQEKINNKTIEFKNINFNDILNEQDQLQRVWLKDNQNKYNYSYEEVDYE